MTKHYLHTGLGGTFDHLHRGHETIIDKAFSLSDKVSIGITTDSMGNDKKFSRSLEPYEKRLDELKNYLHKKNYISRSHIFELKNIYGTALSDRTLDCLVVTSDTLANANLINKKRLELGLKTLDIVEIQLVTGNDQKTISSTRIRKGVINRSGSPYLKLFQEKILNLPFGFRQTLRNPLSSPILGKNSEKSAKIAKDFLLDLKPVLTIAVGDIVSKTLDSVNYTPDISIIDYKSQRKDLPQDEKMLKNTKYRNDPGTINGKVVSKLNDLIEDFLNANKKVTLVIQGEEDLLALPAILLVPLKSAVVYGQVERGVIIVEVTEEMKHKIAEIVKRFTPQKKQAL